MSNTFFQDIQARAFRSGVTPRSDEARKWFREQIRKMQMPSREMMLNDGLVKRVSKPTIGSLVMFSYDAKNKDTLEYWDQFPLAVITGVFKGGFAGLNLHYLHPIARAKLFDALMETTNNKFMNESTKFRVTYNLLQSANKMKAFAPCYKNYLTSHVASHVAVVEAPEWEIAMLMPLQKFVGAGKEYVWRESRKKY